MSLKERVAVAPGSLAICAGVLSHRTQFVTEAVLVCVMSRAAPVDGAMLRANVQLTIVAVDGPPNPSPIQNAAAGRSKPVVLFSTKRQLATVRLVLGAAASPPPPTVPAEFRVNLQLVTVPSP